MDYAKLFIRLWDDYRKINPSVDQIHQLLKAKGERVENDHVALRTYDLPNMNIEILQKPFVDLGYVEKGSYNFDAKKLNAKHFEHSTDASAPKVFISELRTKECSALVRETAKWVAKQVNKASISVEELLFSGRCWSPINYASYEALRKESEYAAWMYAFGFRANHFTVFVNELNNIGSIEELNTTLKQNGFELNTSGGEIKGSVDSGLKQSSTMADKIVVSFSDGDHEIPCCYYEFAERFPVSDGKIFNGFITNSANKIFESTNKA